MSLKIIYSLFIIAIFPLAVFAEYPELLYHPDEGNIIYKIGFSMDDLEYEVHQNYSGSEYLWEYHQEEYSTDHSLQYGLSDRLVFGLDLGYVIKNRLCNNRYTIDGVSNEVERDLDNYKFKDVELALNYRIVKHQKKMGLDIIGKIGSSIREDAKRSTAYTENSKNEKSKEGNAKSGGQSATIAGIITQKIGKKLEIQGIGLIDYIGTRKEKRYMYGIDSSGNNTDVEIDHDSRLDIGFGGKGQIKLSEILFLEGFCNYKIIGEQKSSFEDYKASADSTGIKTTYSINQQKHYYMDYGVLLKAQIFKNFGLDFGITLYEEENFNQTKSYDPNIAGHSSETVTKEDYKGTRYNFGINIIF